MKTQTKHTPVDNYAEWSAWETLYSEGMHRVVRFRRNEKMSLASETLCECYTPEDAVRITRSVNAHDELVALLKDVICPIAEALPQQAPDPDAFVKWQLSFLKRAHEVISKAEGRP